MSDRIVELEIGSIAPDFTLEASIPAPLTLSSYRETHHVIVYFMREFT